MPEWRRSVLYRVKNSRPWARARCNLVNRVGTSGRYFDVLNADSEHGFVVGAVRTRVQLRHPLIGQQKRHRP